MGSLDFDDENSKPHLRRIQQALKQRGLVMNPDDYWEIHGPHEEMNYQTYVGNAYEPDNRSPDDGFLVVIYPREVYQIDAEDQWSRPDEANPLFAKGTAGAQAPGQPGREQ